jgi:MFS family permease
VLPAWRPHPSTLQRNVALDLTSAVGMGTTMAIVSVLLPSLARREGTDAMGLAVLSALPFLATLLSMFAGRIGPRTPSRLALLRAVGALGLLLVLLAPHPLLLAAATFAFWASIAFGSPLEQRIWATAYPAPARGRLLGLVGTGRFAAGTVALAAITALAAGPQWVIVVAVVAAFGAVSSMAVGRMDVPGVASGQRFGAWASLRSVMATPMVRSFATAQLFFGAGMLMAPAFAAMVNVDRLGLSVSDIALAGLLSYGSTAVSIGLWGRLAGSSGPLRIILAGAVLGTVSFVILAWAPNFQMLIVATVLLGLSNAAVNASWPLLIADHAPEGEQAVVAAGLNAVMGMRGLAVPFLMMAPVTAGYIDETGGLLLCAVSGLAGVAVYGRMLGVVRVPDRVQRRIRAFEAGAALLAEPQRRPAMAPIPLSSISGWPVSLRSRLMRSTMAGWVLNKPLALCSSFFTGLTK